MTRFTSKLLVIWVALATIQVESRLLAQTAVDPDSTRTHEVHIESADVLEVDQIDGEQVNRLSGNVVLTQEQTILYADRAVQYQKSDLIVFDGGVEIVDEGDTLRADRIEYQTELKLAKGDGGVVWTDGEVELTARSGEYQVDDKIASFSGDVRMRDSTTTITSETGEYRVDEELATFSRSVLLGQEELDLVADSVSHDRKTGITVAAGSVRIFQVEGDSSDSRIVLVGESAESRREDGSSTLWGSPFLVRITAADSVADTLVVSANQLEVIRTGDTQTFSAKGESRMWQNEISGVADSLLYQEGADADSATILMMGSPVLWNGEAQVSGDTIVVQIDGGSPVSLKSNSNAFVAFEDTSLGRIQQIRGEGLVATFRNDDLRNLVIQPRAEALYFGQGTDDEGESVVRFTSSSITLHFEEGEIGRIVAATDVEGEITEFEQDNAPALEGFEWRDAIRPERAAMMTPELIEALECRNCNRLRW